MRTVVANILNIAVRVTPLLSYTIQVHLQTQQRVERGLLGMAVHVVRSGGVSSLYNGLSASILRQVKCSES